MKLLAGEKIIKHYRQTKLVIVFYFVICCFLFFLPLKFVSRYELGDTLGKIPEIWSICVLLYFINHLVLWGKNKTLLTNHRLLIFNYHNLLHHTVTDLPKDKIVNISYEKKGLMQAIFNFGNVIIQQHSLNQPVILKRLEAPMDVKDEINSIIKTSEISQNMVK